MELLRELLSHVSTSNGIVDAQDSWLLTDVDETTHSGTVQLESYAPVAEFNVGSLIIDSDGEESLYAVPELKSVPGGGDRGELFEPLLFPGPSSLYG